MRKSILVLFLLSMSMSMTMAGPLIACEDPCPSLKLGYQFEQTAMRQWIGQQKTIPKWKGVSSYHVNDSVAHYVTFIADSSTVLVGEADCALLQSNWTLLNWEKVDEEEFKTVSTLETYYQSLPPILELRKAKYGEKLTVYLLKIEFKGSTDWIFRLYAVDEQVGRQALGGAYAHPASAIAKK